MLVYDICILIFSLSSLAGPDSFYVTNDRYFHFDNTFLNFLYTSFLHNFLHANIVFYDGFKAIEAIAGVHPNGIALDKDGRLECAVTRSCNHLMNYKTQSIR